MIAIIKTGGKQYKVSPGDKIKVEKINKEEGKEINFDQVLLFQDKDKIEIGQPLLKGFKVLAKILKQGKADKIIVLKYKPKTRYKVKQGHRQAYTQVEILKILPSSLKS
ncbi:MAG: 50S ribosomal protein L21 [Candidatus Pacebacteria bacterium]|nr:50S ribosomal protein L21 [Candidatus Paceibacterota bacterium]